MSDNKAASPVPCANCGWPLMPAVEPPRHTYGLRRCKRLHWEIAATLTPCPDLGLEEAIYAATTPDITDSPVSP